jgi:peptidoglycan glycosyltransferase
MRKNRKLKTLSLLLGLTAFAGGTFFNVCQGKFEQKVNAAEDQQQAQATSQTSEQKENSRDIARDITHEIANANEVKAPIATAEAATPAVNLVIPPLLKESLEKSFMTGLEWPDTLRYQNKSFRVEYTFNAILTGYIKNLLKQYRSDYTTVTVIDNQTGKVLAAIGYQGKENKFDKNLILTSSHPSASLIKVVTAAELLQNTQVRKDTMFDFRGRSTTLFKYQLNDSRGRFGKTQTFETAFAKSNNVIFGKAAIKNTTSANLVKMAESFGFNQPILREFSFLKSAIHPAHDEYEFAELASGFNNETVISPVHAAAMASIIANDGILKTPKIISNIVDQKSGESVWQESNEEKRVITLETSKEMQELMGMTIDGGTARRSFRGLRGGYKDALEIGGKTGHITGGIPFGKRDWFAAYAIPREKNEGKGISISVMNVNVKRWHVKSAQLAKSIIEYYYKSVSPIALNNSRIDNDEVKRVPSSVKSKRRHIKRKHKRTVRSA